MKAREIAYTALFIALTAVGAWIEIPIGPVPVTLQVLMVLLAGLLLGARLGFITMLLYVLAGVVGFPVFSGFSGGLVHLYGPSGGYIIAFPLAAYITGWFAEHWENTRGYLIGSLLAIGVIYLLGWLRLSAFLAWDTRKAFILGIAPFIGVDILKALIAVGITEKVRKVMEY